MVLTALTLAALPGAPAAAFEVVGHRGARGLAPENTLPGFMTALRVGVSALEVDVVVSRDDVLVARHDRRVDPDQCTGGFARRFYKNLTLRQIRRLDCGSGAHVPALSQVFRLGRPSGVRFVVEVKNDPTAPRETLRRRAFAKRIVKHVRRMRMIRRTTIQAFDWGVLRDVARIEPRLRLAALASPITTYPGSPWLAGVRVRNEPFTAGLASAVKRAGFDVVSPSARSVNPSLVQASHHRGLQIVPWTVNSPRRMQALIAMGVDGLITDYPDRLRTAAAAMGTPVPSGGG
jgi:glycerophosphoryl diester phosphodiesterase